MSDPEQDRLWREANRLADEHTAGRATFEEYARAFDAWRVYVLIA